MDVIERFKQQALECSTINEIKHYLNTLQHTHEATYKTITNYFKYNPHTHIPFIGALEEKWGVSRQEVAYALNATFYIQSGTQLINALKNPPFVKSTIKSLIEQGADINYSLWSVETYQEDNSIKKSIQGTLTPLWYAYKQDDIFTYLLQNGALPDQARDSKGRSLLVKLCEKYSSDYLQKNPDKITIAQGHIQRLLTKGANPHLLDWQNYNLSGYHYKEPPKEIALIIDNYSRGAPIFGKNFSWKVPKKVSMHRKIYRVSTQKLPDLMKSTYVKIFPNQYDYKRNTLLHHLITMHTHRTDTEGKDEGCRAYIYQAIETLLNNNANPNQPDGLGNTALHLALNDVEPE